MKKILGIILCLFILSGCGYQQGYDDGYGGYDKKRLSDGAYKRGFGDGRQDFYEDTGRRLQ